MLQQKLNSYRPQNITLFLQQCAKKVVSDSPGLVDFAILGLQPRDKAAMLGVKTKEYFLEEFT